MQTKEEVRIRQGEYYLKNRKKISAWQKEYNQRPGTRLRNKLREQTPECKETKRRYNQRLDVKARKKITTKEWKIRNPQKVRLMAMRYINRHPDRIKEYKKRPEVIERLKEQREKYKTDPIYLKRIKERGKKYRIKNKEKIREWEEKYYSDPNNRIKRIKRVKLKKYNLTQTEYNQMYQDHDGKCSVCEVKNKLVIDHIHNEDKTVRGLLCHNCNSMLGFASDNEEILEKAIRYLNKETK